MCTSDMVCSLVLLLVAIIIFSYISHTAKPVYTYVTLHRHARINIAILQRCCTIYDCQIKLEHISLMQ